jgi:hypothetical protein
VVNKHISEQMMQCWSKERSVLIAKRGGAVWITSQMSREKENGEQVSEMWSMW